MILIDNIKTLRNLFYFLKINNNLKSYKYIYFCYGITTIPKNLSIYINSKKIDYYFFKKLKSIKYLVFLQNYLKNSLVLFCTNEESVLPILSKELKNFIIFCKIDNNFYSLNNIETYCNSKMDLISYINNYYYNFIYTLDNLKNNK